MEGEAGARRGELLAALQPRMLLLNGAKQSLWVQVGKGLLSGGPCHCPGLMRGDEGGQRSGGDTSEQGWGRMQEGQQL